MEKSEIKGFIAKRCAKELKDGDVVNLGIGLPTLIPHYLPEGVEVIIHAELGIVSAGVSPKEGDANYDPYHVVDAGGTPSSVAYGGGFIDSATNFGLIRGGHVDACVRRLFFLPVPTHLEPSIDGDRIKHSHTPPTMREKP